MIKKAILLVAGYGTRFLPATKNMPKEMLPVVDKPIIQYLVEEVVAAGIEEIYLAQVQFPSEADLEEAKLFTWPKVSQFPADAPLADKRVLVMNNAWGSGRTTWAVYKQVEGAGGIPSTCVLHYNPYRNLLKYQPDYYGAITDAYILYPWDIDQAGPDRVFLENGGRG